ncbi:hypothetical protein BASA81_009101 [Batrachochytrium salamandrivorans]|nr:hypothetical protein BASA81_009101 [Batrachochytrium salamandrivorans]
MTSRVDKTREAIIQLERERQERRVVAAESKKKRSQDAQSLYDKGKIGDSDFVAMIERFRDHFPAADQADASSPSAANMFQNNKINVAVRKRPTSEREIYLQDHDSVTCSDPLVYVHSCKLKVDGITKVLENTRFEFDFAFDSEVSNEEIYQQTTLPLVKWAVTERGRSTVFAYGQTGSGKTFTMEGLQQRVARDLFAMLEHENVRVMCSNFELYGTQCLDLLNEQKVLPIREDEKNCVHIVGLKEEEAESEEELLAILNRGSANRTTRATEMNSDSSRSHSIFQINLCYGNRSTAAAGGGTILLVDLAGSERGQDTKHHDATRRSESAAINTSLLSLKECIRALENGGSASTHVPYRQSKLTMVLKDSFSSSLRSKTLMIGCISPAASSSDHTLNTLRYADRVKEKKSSGGGVAAAAATRPSLASSRPAPLTSRPSLGGSSKPRISLAPPAPTPTHQPPQQQQQQQQARMSRPSTSGSSSFKPLIKAPPAPTPIQVPLSPAPSSHHHPHHAPRVVVETPRAPPPPPPTTLTSTTPIIYSRASIKKESTLPKTSVAALLDEEDALLSAYRDAVQENFHLLAEESNILTQLSEQVEYDVFASTEELRILLEHKLMLFGDLHQRLVRFQTNVRNED